ncbi:hypothetical protein ACLOJK_028616 [Asimina triloba]
MTSSALSDSARQQGVGDAIVLFPAASSSSARVQVLGLVCGDEPDIGHLQEIEAWMYKSQEATTGSILQTTQADAARTFSALN